MADDEAKLDYNPFWSALQKEREREFRQDCISWQRVLLRQERRDAEAEGDTARVETLTREIRELMKRERALR